ncbi:hypothetical protein SAMN05216390_11827 [Lachnospiraceae bacterium KH1T2]|nr:hypothetical protein SAMN05216390_11827 [Lachnospiraceae bacterium KH1T2]
MFFRFFTKKNRKVISSAIIIFLIIAMVLAFIPGH